MHRITNVTFFWRIVQSVNQLPTEKKASFQNLSSEYYVLLMQKEGLCPIRQNAEWIRWKCLFQCWASIPNFREICTREGQHHLTEDKCLEDWWTSESRKPVKAVLSQDDQGLFWMISILDIKISWRMIELKKKILRHSRNDTEVALLHQPTWLYGIWDHWSESIIYEKFSYSGRCWCPVGSVSRERTLGRVRLTASVAGGKS